MKERRSERKSDRKLIEKKKIIHNIFIDLINYQKLLKSDQNAAKVSQVQMRECKELLIDQHNDYYDELL